MTNLHLEGLETRELVELADQALASLNARLVDDGPDGVREEFPTISGADKEPLSRACAEACDAWDRFADLVPDFRE